MFPVPRSQHAPPAALTFTPADLGLSGGGETQPAHTRLRANLTVSRGTATLVVALIATFEPVEGEGAGTSAAAESATLPPSLGDSDQYRMLTGQGLPLSRGNSTARYHLVVVRP